MNPEDRPLNKEELDLLPFDFKDAYYAAPDPHGTSYYFAKWHGRLVYSTNPNEGWFFDDNDSDVGLNHWEQYYPGFQYLTNPKVAPNLLGTYKGKSVRWSRSQNQWQFLNHRPVDFTADDEQQVSTLLESATLSTSRALSSFTPEPRTQSLPGELPESPKPLPISAATSYKGKHPISTVPSRTSTPVQSSSLAPPPLATSRFSTAVPLTTMSTSTPKLIGSPPESYDGSGHKAESFWSSLESYYFLNQDVFRSESRRVASALSHFKLGTPAGEWARDRQQTALALTNPDFGTWDDFRTAFKNHFIPVETKMSSTQLMHSLRQNTRPFHEWYQEWITHANRSGANDQTKMFAFRRNIPSLETTRCFPHANHLSPPCRTGQRV
jgi:Retrotransposon gag protein